ncbi:MAG TPA: hypothetical protein VMR81_07295 [Patescibacteria group bacterium]|nr:hypothetical protein [Patescibacteria group bacterium]
MNFIFALIVSVITLAGGSLLWPRLTAQKRPSIIQQVHDVVLKTSIGEQSANVLGVSDEAHVKPLNAGQIVSGVVGAAEGAVQSRIQTIIVKNAVNQLTAQFDKLPADQKQEIQQALCKPPAKK